MKNYFKLLFSALILVSLPGCFFYKKKITRSIFHPENITVSVHGTLPPVVRNFVKALESPHGLCPLADRPNAFVLSRMGYVLHESDPKMFPVETFYLYGWSGKLSFDERKNEAEKLYQALKKLTGKITLIGHSHGGNVIFNLAKIVEKHNDKDFKINKLILLATPVQEVYVNFANSPVFEEIISLYSTADSIQVLDPQGLYKKSKKLNTNGFKVPLFSNRLLPDSPKIKQVRILIDKCNPGHMDFIRPKFLKALPEILNLVANGPENQRRFIVNISRKGKPYLVKLIKRRDGRRVYVPVNTL